MKEKIQVSSKGWCSFKEPFGTFNFDNIGYVKISMFPIIFVGKILVWVLLNLS